MPHLAVLRRGWQNEHLAAFMLSRLAFLAHPAKIGDDIGTDFFCTLFETVNQDGRDYLVPRKSFAIQIKSSGTTIDATKQIKYLIGLELPFFVGIIDQEHSSLTIYSGEYLPILFSYRGIPKSLTLELHSQHDFGPDSYFDEVADNSYKLKCPVVSTLSVAMTTESIAEESRRLGEVASRIHRNIAAQATHEYIFSVGSDGQTPMIMAGPGSVQVFRDNFKKRLAEVFFNLIWILDNLNYQSDIGECRFYERIYDAMCQREKSLPTYLTAVAEKLKRRLSSA
jgi:hypothetical protein